MDFSIAERNFYYETKYKTNKKHSCINLDCYLSMIMLNQHLDRSLVFTIYTNKVFDHEHFKRAIYQKPHRVLYGTLSAPDNFTYSMMIAGDVECSKTGAVQCPSDITDQIGGWTTGGVGQGYGSGYPLSVMQEWLEKTHYFTFFADLRIDVKKAYKF